MGKSADVFRLVVRDEDGVEPLDLRRPGPVQFRVAGARVEENRPIPPGADEISVRHPDTVGHAKRVQAKGELDAFGQRISPLGEGIQADLIEPEDRRQPAEFGGGQVGPVIHRIAKPADVQLRGPRQAFQGQRDIARGLLEHVAKLVFEGG